MQFEIVDTDKKLWVETGTSSQNRDDILFFIFTITIALYGFVGFVDVRNY